MHCTTVCCIIYYYNIAARPLYRYWVPAKYIVYTYLHVYMRGTLHSISPQETHYTPYYTCTDVNFIILLLLLCIYFFFYLPRRPRPDLSVRDGFHLITLKIETPYKTAYDHNNRGYSYPAMREILISTFERTTTVTAMVRNI